MPPGHHRGALLLAVALGAALAAGAGASVPAPAPAPEQLCVHSEQVGVCLPRAACRAREGYPAAAAACTGDDAVCCTAPKCASGGGRCMHIGECKLERVRDTTLCPGPAAVFQCCRTPDHSPGLKVVAAAAAALDKFPYSWYGGTKDGPSRGLAMRGAPGCDDSKVTGFDSGGLVLYAVYQATGTLLPRAVSDQFEGCRHLVPFADRRPGDAVFFGSERIVSKVAIVDYDTNAMIEAPEHGASCARTLIRRSPIRADVKDKVCRYW